MTAIVRLIWKEYRMLRGFWLALAVCGVFIQLLLVEFVRDMEERRNGLQVCVLVMTYCFALGAAATAFAVEREEGTHGFLQFLPFTSSRLFAGKLVLVFIATVLMAVSLGAVAMVAGQVVADMTREKLQAILPWGLIYSIVLLHTMGWGLFFSLKSARPLLAAFLGVVATGASLFLVAWITFLLFEVAQSRPVTGREWHVSAAMATAALWYIDVRIGRAWLLGREVPRRRGQRERQPALRRLVWQEWRRSHRTLAALFGVGFLGLGVFVPWLMLAGPDPLAGTVTVGIVLAGWLFALFGACTFLGDQEQWQFRFFAERGVAARTVWLGRQAFWAGTTLAVACLLLIELRILAPIALPRDQIDTALWKELQIPLSWFALEIDEYPAWRLQWSSGMAAYFLWVLSAFGAGQLCSMFFRSGLLAAVFGLMLAGLLLGWAALMQILHIGWWWSVAPLAIAMFAATWLRSTGWILDRRGIRAWLMPALVVLLPMIALPAAVPFYRVREVPTSNVEMTALPWRSVISEDATLVVRTLEQLPPIRTSLEALHDPGNAEPTSSQREWLKANEMTLNVAVRALLRLRADVSVLDIASNSRTTWQELAAMILRYGQLAEGEGNLALAWDRYRAVLHFSRSLCLRCSAAGETAGGQIQTAACAQLIRWGARQGQTADKLLLARTLLQQLDRQEEPLANVVRRDYQEILAFVDEGQARPEKWDPRTELVAKWAPWEFTRARRLLRYAMGLYLLDAQDADAVLAGRATPAERLSSWRAYELQQAGSLWQTSLLPALSAPVEIIEKRRLTVAYRRATQLALAAEAWWLEHGELPKTLAELERTYFEKLPIDPFNNQPFEWRPWGLIKNIRSDNVAMVPAGTPLIYSQGNHVISTEYLLNRFNSLRRDSPDDPLGVESEPAGGSGMPGAAGGASPPGGIAPAGIPAGGGPLGAGAAGPGAPPPQQNPAFYEPPEYIQGLMFPIPVATSDKRKQQSKEPE